MNGKPIHLYQPVGQDETASDVPPVIETQNIASLQNGTSMRQFGLSLIPFTPVPFTGDKSAFAYLRLGVYGTLAVLTWEKYRRLSYVCIGAASVSAASSFAASAWNKS